MKTRWPLVRILAILLLFSTGVYVFQDRYLYFPEVLAPSEYAALRPDLVAWPDQGELRGLLRVCSGQARATAIVFHGNAGHAAHRGWYADQLCRQGLRVVLAEYPGYGPRPGKPSEAALIEDAAQTVALARRSFGQPLLLIGESLGAAVAAGAAQRQPDDVAGLLLITPWDRLENVARHHYGFLGRLLREPYDSAARLAHFPHPILVAVAENDTIVPPRLGRALFEGLSGKKQLRLLAGADHNDWQAVTDDAWWESAIRFLAPASAGRMAATPGQDPGRND